MNVRPLAVSDGTRRGTVEWPLKAEYTVKGRAVSGISGAVDQADMQQEIICDVVSDALFVSAEILISVQRPSALVLRRLRR